jgi:hypothetical protein
MFMQMMFEIIKCDIDRTGRPLFDVSKYLYVCIVIQNHILICHFRHIVNIPKHILLYQTSIINDRSTPLYIL